MSEDKQPKLRLWISGYLSEEMTVSELFLIARNRLSVSLMLALGLTSGSVTSAGYEIPITVVPAFLFVNAIAPPLLIFLAAFLIAGTVHLHHRLIGRRTGKILTIPTAVSTTIAFVPTYILIEYVRVYLMGEELDLTWYIFIIPYLPFIAISEILISAIVKFLSPSILSKTLNTSDIAPAALAMTKDLKTYDETDVATEVEQGTAPDQFEQVFIEVGEKRIAVSDVVMLEAEGNYVRFVTPDNSFLERASMKEMVDKLCQLGMQVHRSKWISYAHVIDQTHAAGQLRLTMLGGHKVNVAVRRIKEVEKAIEHFRESRS